MVAYSQVIVAAPTQTTRERTFWIEILARDGCSRHNFHWRCACPDILSSPSESGSTIHAQELQGMIEARAQGDLAYDALMALPHLDAVVRESIRLCQVHGTATNRIVPSRFFLATADF